MASLLSRDPVFIALLPVALRAPWFLFALPAGVITDRTDRRRLIVAMDVLRASAFAIAALVIWSATPLADAANSGISSLRVYLWLIVCAFIVGSAEVFRDNAAQTMLPSLVPQHTLERANGRLWSVELTGNALLGPAIGAFLVTSVVWLPFAVNAFVFAMAMCMVLSLKGSFLPEQNHSRDWKRELQHGLDFLYSQPLLQLLAVITGVWNLLHQIVLIALVLHVQENLNLNATGYGLILAAGAVGGIIGGFVADRVVKLIGAARAAQWMTLASAVAFLMIPFAPNGYVLALVLAGFEFTGLIWNTVSVSYRQRIIPDNLLGRVNSIYRLLAWGMMPAGLLMSGVIVSVSEGLVSRETALTVPFLVAAVGAWLLTGFSWRPLARGFSNQTK